jgi:hypothetical protein
LISSAVSEKGIFRWRFLTNNRLKTNEKDYILKNKNLVFNSYDFTFILPADELTNFSKSPDIED